jgi:hypothetical protein
LNTGSVFNVNNQKNNGPQEFKISKLSKNGSNLKIEHSPQNLM